MIIRNAKISDAEAISRLVTYWARQHLENPASPEATAYLDTLAPGSIVERINAANLNYYVAQNDAGLCGVIAIRDGYRIHHLFVHPEAHKQGIARALWEHAKTRSESSTFVVNSSVSAVPVYAVPFVPRTISRGRMAEASADFHPRLPRYTAMHGFRASRRRTGRRGASRPVRVFARRSPGGTLR